MTFAIFTAIVAAKQLYCCNVTSDVKTEFFYNQLSICWNRFFTDNQNVIIIWNYRWTPHRQGLCKVPCWRYL